MFDLTIYEHLKNRLKVCRLTTSKDETIIRCPFCGDSVKDQYHAHFYIQNKAPYKYFCQKCNTRGITNISLLNKLNVSDINLINHINKSYSNFLKESSYKYSNNINVLSNKKFTFKKDLYTDNDFEKIEYIENRLGIQLDEDDLDKYKIVLNVKDFLIRNKLFNSKRFSNPAANEKLNTISNDTVGFLSSDKNLIVCRNIRPDAKYRYSNFRIIVDEDGPSKKFYSISNKLDLNKDYHRIIIAEGVFDILGVFNHIYNGVMNDNDIFIANNGKSFPLVLNTLLSMGVANCDILIYSDKDVNVDFYRKLKEEVPLMFFNGASIFYNSIGKDYGVKSADIKLKEEYIKI